MVFTFVFKDLGFCKLLNLILNLAVTFAGITL